MQLSPQESQAIEQASLGIVCVGGEDRCLACLRLLIEYRVNHVLLLSYDPLSAKADRYKQDALVLLKDAKIPCSFSTLFEDNPGKSLVELTSFSRRILSSTKQGGILLDISVLNKMHLLMMLNWLDEMQVWEETSLVYTEPSDYPISRYSPMYIGFKRLIPILGFPPPGNLGRKVHLVLFLGYDSSRARYLIEKVSVEKLSLLIATPYQKGWIGRTETINAEIIKSADPANVHYVSGLDPYTVFLSLTDILGDPSEFDDYMRVICPLGTKPQTVGAFLYHREAVDQPAILYVRPQKRLLHRAGLGCGPTWIVKGIGS